MVNTQKILLLMRHAKSSWENTNLGDFDRPLNKRGKKDAPVMGAYLKKRQLIPDQIFCSPAKRAEKTVRMVTAELDVPPESIVWDETLYFNGPDAYLNAFRNADESSRIVMTVGHNPMTEEVLSLLANRPVNDHISTATIACLGVEGIDSWSRLEYGMCKVHWIIRPKDIS